ncbi:MAG TPA: hypothetical protein DD435_16410 [Cyanobacteria bacterium UBA8530]|nr:hypothetical protein [Cyanobacteria bacterium UBA8530]
MGVAPLYPGAGDRKPNLYWPGFIYLQFRDGFFFFLHEALLPKGRKKRGRLIKPPLRLRE